MPHGLQGLGGDRQSGVHGERTWYRRAVNDEETVMGVGKLGAASIEDAPVFVDGAPGRLHSTGAFDLRLSRRLVSVAAVRVPSVVSDAAGMRLRYPG